MICFWNIIFWCDLNRFLLNHFLNFIEAILRVVRKLISSSWTIRIFSIWWHDKFIAFELKAIYCAPNNKSKLWKTLSIWPKHLSIFTISRSRSVTLSLECRSQNMRRPSGIAVSHPERICVFLISFYRWWTCIIFIIRPTSCLARLVNNSWANQWRKSSKPFYKRSKVICEPSSVSLNRESEPEFKFQLI